MLKFQNITKSYKVGDMVIPALKGITIEFRKHEFVSVLGPSGCGKTTFLNIIGGLDRYDDGDLSVNGKSTKKFTERDWDNYRNHSVGFVFQSYNLIPHQTVLANVELALTLSGISKKERRKRAEEVLKKVGLGDQMKKKPNQLSGGQMQRVAIARALVNDPEILLADEPTGALDSETSVQIMNLLKEISDEKLIIMVTHNPELAEQYSTRIVKLLDGKITSDSMPFSGEETVPEKETKKDKKPSMSFFTALSLSFTNLLTKKGRTFLTAFAGSIGIIGIALIMSLANGFNAYINKVEEDTLSSYPLEITSQTVNMSSLLTSFSDMKNAVGEDREEGKIYSANIMSDMMATMLAQIETNDLTEFKNFIDKDASGIKDLTNDIRYIYDINTCVYTYDKDGNALQVNPSSIMKMFTAGTGSGGSGTQQRSVVTSGMEIWSEMIDNDELLKSQYDIVAGRWPQNYDEVVFITNESRTVSDFVLYSLGLKDQSELKEIMEKASKGEEYETEAVSFTYDEILNLEYSLLLPTDIYQKDENGKWVDKSRDAEFMKELVKNGTKLKIVGIIVPSDNTVMKSAGGSIGYLRSLTEHVIEKNNDSEILKAQKADKETDIFTGLPFSENGEVTYNEFDYSSLSDEQKAYLATLSQEELAALMESYRTPTSSSATYEGNLAKLSAVDTEYPSAIYIYPKDFDAKEKIVDIIEKYNNDAINDGHKEKSITYTDYVSLLISSVSTIVNTISYVLIAFVSISLVVSSIMIGIITYISVLERTKEIGILRSIGASKKDIRRVFNAETLIVGAVAGLIGIGVTLLLLIPINLIIQSLSGIVNVAVLPLNGAIFLVVISMILTLIAGLIPSGLAAKKDPVVALRTE